MNVNFNLVWFENEDDNFETDEPIIKALIEKQAFIPKIERYKDDKFLEDTVAKADLVIADFDLGTSNSIDIIKGIRNNDIVTDVLFYSSKRDITDRIRAAEPMLEGFFYVKRGDDFAEKVRLLVDRVVKRNQTVENLRGMMMEFTAIFDKKIYENICRFCENSSILNDAISYINKDIANNYKERTFEHCAKKSDCSLKNCTYRHRNIANIDEIDSFGEFDSYTKCRILHHILTKKGIIEFNDFYYEYINEIIHYRNAFAHEKSDENRIYIKSKQTYEIVNEVLFQKIRGYISKYQRLINVIGQIA